MKKKNLKVLQEMSKDQLIDNLMKNSIKGGCCSGTGNTRPKTNWPDMFDQGPE